MEQKITTNEYFSFDDVLIRPAASDIEPDDANLRSECARGLFLSTPVLSAAMDKVSETDMAMAMDKAGGMAVIHRSCSAEQEVQMVADAAKQASNVAAAVGVHDVDRATALVEHQRAHAGLN